MRKFQDFSHTLPSQSQPASHYKTFTNFSKHSTEQPPTSNKIMSLANEETLESEQFEAIRQVVKCQMVGILRSIKTEIESKIKEIDGEIRQIRQQIFKLKEGSDQKKLIQRVEVLERRTGSIVVQGRHPHQPDNPGIPLYRRNNQVLQRVPSQRSLSRQKKRIFPSKADTSLSNLSNILFPDEESQKMTTYRAEDKVQYIETLLNLPIPLVQQYKQPKVEVLDVLSPLQHPLQQSNLLLSELNKNKAQFLKNKSRSHSNSSQQPSPKLPDATVARQSPFEYTSINQTKTNQTIFQEQHQQSSILSTRHKQQYGRS